jgi:hypothetical protein
MASHKFSMRDFLWAVLVLGLALGWTLDRRTVRRELEAAEAKLTQVNVLEQERDILRVELMGLSEALKNQQAALRHAGAIP